MPHDDASQFGLDPRLVARYLTSNGWQLDQLRSNLRRIWLPEEGAANPIEIFLSFDTKSQDRDLAFALTTISQYYERSVETLASEIRALSCDIISSKIPDEYVRNDSIELRIASEYLDRMRVFLAASATTELNGERFYKRLRKEAVEYSERCRFGHTFRGSFGFHIESPVGLNDAPSFEGIDEEVPFGRLVVERISRGLSSLSQAALQGNPNLIVAEGQGLSANMCEAIISIIEDIGVSRIDMQISFSPEWRPRVSPLPTKFSMHFQQLDILKDAAKALRVDDPPRHAQVFGRIKRLETEGNPADLIEDKSRREIEVSWVNEENQLVQVRVALSPEAYLDALEAHKNGHAVLATGIVSKVGRNWRLDPIETFKIVS
ncbi:hypothetical protein [Ensifer sp. 4252]|uniref:hypothetical protein n=1 Tax=Ensifer sp. 4252 TaxID=3373915 RepID=UPI003D1A1630